MGRSFCQLVVIDAELLEEQDFCERKVNVDFITISGIFQQIHHNNGIVALEYLRTEERTVRFGWHEQLALTPSTNVERCTAVYVSLS